MAWDSISDQAKFKIIFAYKDHMSKSESPTKEHRTAKVHDSVTPTDTAVANVDLHEESHEEQYDDIDTTLLIQAATQKSNIAPADIRRVLSNKNSRKPTKPNLQIETSIHELTYHVSNHYGFINDTNSLDDRGANGGLAGSNMRVIVTTDRRVDISGIDNHQMTGLKIVTAGGVVPTQRGEVIGIFHQYASVPQG